MTKQTPRTLLLDHVDMREVTADSNDARDERRRIVQLDPDHPGFRDAEYRARRNRIARLASEYKPGMPIPDAPYTPEEHRLWQIVWSALEPAHERYACAEYLEAIRKVDLPRERIPQLREVSAKVQAISGFRLEPVAGLVEPRAFLESLADGVFSCTQYIRHHSTPLYTPEPDVVHEVVGHGVSLADERLSELNRLFGAAVKRTRSAEGFEQLSCVYWFTVEFGVVREQGEVKAYGTGLLSSAGELEEMQKAELRPLDLETAARQAYDPTSYQPVLFCADSFDEMYRMLKNYLIHWK